MRYLKWILPILVILGAVFISRMIKNSRPPAEVKESVEKLTIVRVVTAVQSSFQPAIKSQGTVRPKRTIQLVPEVAGKVIWVSPNFTSGGSFNKGEALLRIDPSNYEFAIDRARADVADAQSKLQLELAEADIASRDWEEIGEGRPASDLALRKPQLAGAKAKLASAKAELHKAELDLKRTTITGPFKGRVDMKNVDIGQYVSLGTNLAGLYSTDYAEIYLPLTDSQLALIDLHPTYQKGTSDKDLPYVNIEAVVAGKRREWKGHIVRTAGAVDQDSRVLNVIVEVENPYDVKAGGAPLMNGLFVQAAIQGVTIDNVVELPRGALRNQDQVVIVDSENKMWSRNVDVVHAEAQSVVVTGIAAGASVVVSPLDLLIEGAEVSVIDGPAL